MTSSSAVARSDERNRPAAVETFEQERMGLAAKE
jgi:hypothetical protein